MPNEVLTVEVEMRAREALQQFEKLDAQFRETAGSNKALYQQLHREHRKYVTDVERENKKRASDEAWLSRELSKEGEKRKGVILKEAREERRFANELTKEMQQRVKDERWLTRELAKEQKQREREAERANQKTSRFGGGMGSGGIGDKVFAAYAATDTVRVLAELADNAFRATDRLNAVKKGLETVYGSAEIANKRFKELNELAKFPGLDPAALAKYDAIFKNLGSTAAENNIIFTGTAKAVTTFGGDAQQVNSTLFQLSQGFSKNKIDAQDFKSIIEQTSGSFITTAQEVLGFTGGIEGMRKKFLETGGTLQDFLLPVFAALDKKFEGAPVDSYTNAMDNLGVAFKNLVAATISNTSAFGKFLNGITGTFEGVTRFIEGTDDARDTLQTFRESLKDADTVLERSNAIDARISHFEKLKKTIFDAANELDRFDRKGRERLQGEIDAANEEIGTLALIKSAELGVTQLKSEIDDLIDTYSELAAEETKREAQTKLTHLAVSNVAAARLILIREEKDEVASQIEQYQGYVKVAEAAAKGLNTALQPDTTTSAKEALDALGESQARTVQRTKELAGEIITAEQAHRNLTAVVDSTNLAYNDFQSRIQASALAVARYTGEIEGVQEPFTAYTALIHASTAALEDEAKALATVTQRITQQTQDAEALVHIQELLTQRTDAHNAALVNPAVSDAVDSFRAYNAVLSDSGVKFKTVEDISEDLIASIRGQSEVFDDLRESVGAAEISLDDIDATFDRIPDAIDPAIVSMEDFETVGLRALRAIGDELSAFEGNLGGIGMGIDNMVTLFANPVSFAANTLGKVLEGLSNIDKFGGAIGLPEGFFDDPVPGQERVNPQNVAQNEQRAANQVHHAGIARYLSGPDPSAQIGMLKENDPGIFQRHNTRGFIEQNFPELVDVIYPSGEGSDASGFLARQGTAQSLAEATGTDRQSIEDTALAMYGPEDYAAEVAAATGEALSDIPEPDLPALPGSEAGVPDPTPDPLGTFSFTRDEREALAPYLTAVREAEDAIEDLTEDSTPQEIADAYEALVFAQTNLSSITEGIIRAAEEVGRITGTAATNAITTLGLDLGDDLRTANNALISTLGDVGYEVVGGIENIRKAIDVSDISSAFRRIPEEVEAAAEAEPETEAEVQELQSAFSFSRDQRGILGPLVGEVTAAQDFIDKFLTEDSTPEEIEAAYQRLTDAETALFNQKVQFILLASDITDEARGRALTVEGQIFDREIREANDDLVDAFEEIGHQLVNALTFTSGILRDTALATQKIPEEVEAAADEAEAAADEIDPITTLRSDSRLAANQVRRSRTALGGATGEQDFEKRRVGLIQAANVAYTTQIALLDALGLSEADYQDRFEDAQDTRDGIITRATTATNTFTQTRIKGEEDAAQAVQDAADEATDAAERAAAEAMRIAERHQRDIQALKDDAFDVEKRRADARAELEQDTQDRITDIIRDANRSKEDIERDFQQDFQDITRERTEAQNEVIRQRNEGTITSGEADERFEALARESASRLTELGIERLRDLEDAGIRQGRRTDDAKIRQDRSAQDIEQRATTRQEDIQAQSDALATAIQVSLTPLLEQQQTGEIAEKQIEAAADAQVTAATDLGTVATALKDSDISGAIDLVRESAAASLGISSAILALPGLLEGSFAKIFDDLQKTIVDILQVEAGISGGVGQYLLNTLIESEGAVTGIVGQTAAAALRSLGINPEQFAPPVPAVEASTELQEMLSETNGALDVNVVNPDSIYDPARIAELGGQGLNNREIGMTLREAVLDPMIPDMSIVPPETLIGPNALETGGGGPVEVTGTVSVSNIGDLTSATPSGGAPSQQSQPINVYVTLDPEQIVTPRFAEIVSDQLSINEQSGGARR